MHAVVLDSTCLNSRSSLSRGRVNYDGHAVACMVIVTTVAGKTKSEGKAARLQGLKATLPRSLMSVTARPFIVSNSARFYRIELDLEM